MRKPCEMSKYKMLRLPSYVSLNLNFMTYYIKPNIILFQPIYSSYILSWAIPEIVTPSLFNLIELNDANGNMFLFLGFVITTTAAAGSHSHRALHRNHYHQGQWEDSNDATLVLQFANFCIN